MKKIILSVLALLSFSSCSIYKKYKPAPEVPENLYGKEVTVKVDSTDNIASRSWREFFTDSQLQTLIEEGLRNNTDLQSAQWRVKEAEAALTAAKLAYLPSFNLAPNGNVSSFDNSKVSWSYTAPVTASWEIDIFNKLTNSKRQAKALMLQSKEYEQAVQTQLIASIANSYYTLLMLDEQYSISKETACTYKESVRAMRAMKKAGMANDAGVSQMEAAYYAIESSLQDIERSINEVENTLSVLLGSVPREIERNNLDTQTFTCGLDIGVPIQLLSNRPDVRASEQALAQAFYATNIAHSAFYPSLTLSGTAGWTNNLGSAIMNPGKVILSAAGSLVQPIFNRGHLHANMKIAKAQQEEAKLAFQQSLLNAGKEVNDALTQYQKSEAKVEWRKKQIASLENAVKKTELLMKHSSTTYLEVLTAQQTLLQARLSQATDRFESIRGIVNLYHALGGGRDNRI
ncbi:MAG: efflux transporter outer membrane subunit [Parabacteroides gordonii]|nr:efflux transporter outer membrane subunit [Parabacteroides gordonii]